MMPRLLAMIAIVALFSARLNAMAELPREQGKIAWEKYEIIRGQLENIRDVFAAYNLYEKTKNPLYEINSPSKAALQKVGLVDKHGAIPADVACMARALLSFSNNSYTVERVGSESDQVTEAPKNPVRKMSSQSDAFWRAWRRQRWTQQIKKEKIMLLS